MDVKDAIIGMKVRVMSLQDHKNIFNIGDEGTIKAVGYDDGVNPVRPELVSVNLHTTVFNATYCFVMDSEIIEPVR